MSARHIAACGVVLTLSLLLVPAAGAAEALFEPPATYPNGSFGSGFGHGAVVTADLDGDGFPDIAVADAQAGAIRVLLNDGDGTFGDSVSYPVGASAGSVTAADFDGDGHTDLAATDQTATRLGPEGLVILTNQGDGTFARTAAYPTGSFPAQVKSADFNRDGWIDLATVGTEGFENVVVMLNDGAGDFERTQTLTVGTVVLSMETADVDGDGSADLVVGDGPSGVHVLLGDGHGTFSAGTTIPADFGVEGFATGDLNADGHIDVVLPQLLLNSVAVHLGNGDGSFAAAIHSTVNPQANPVGVPPTINVAAAVADFDGDHVGDDVVVSGGADDHLYVLLGDGAGGLTFAEHHAVRVPRTFVPDDLDRDGGVDVVVSGPETAVLLHRPAVHG